MVFYKTLFESAGGNFFTPSFYIEKTPPDVSKRVLRVLLRRIKKAVNSFLESLLLTKVNNYRAVFFCRLISYG